MTYLGKTGRKRRQGLSRRDLPVISSRAAVDGATTVTTTMMIAHMAGISVFATGGIGGVHRGAETTMDISADLEELAQTPVMVVCAGAKAILDLGLTLEYLETKGVPVHRLRHGRAARVLHPRERPRRRLRASTRRRIWLLSSSAQRDLGLQDRHARHQPHPGAVRHGQGRHRQGHRAGARRERRNRACPRQGDHAVPARPRGRS